MQDSSQDRVFFDVSPVPIDFGSVSEMRIALECNGISSHPAASVSRSSWQIIKEDKLQNAATGSNSCYWSASLVCTSRMKLRTGSGWVRFMRWPAPWTMQVGWVLAGGIRRSREPWM